MVVIGLVCGYCLGMEVGFCIEFGLCCAFGFCLEFRFCLGFGVLGFRLEFCPGPCRRLFGSELRLV